MDNIREIHYCPWCDWSGLPIKMRNSYWCPNCYHRFTSTTFNKEEKIDISFDLWMVDKFHFHRNKSLMVTKNWEDIAALLCENLITIMKYKEACKQGNELITKNETMQDYILSRLENIQSAYSSLYIFGKLTTDEFNYFERNQKTILFMLTGEGDDIDRLKDYFKEANWKDEIIFNDYINTILNSTFFKNNDIRIE